MPRRAPCVGLCLAVFASVAPALASDYYRWPAVSGDALVFASEGDLWRADRDGGSPVRLTTHVEDESSPAISPDGAWLAFDAHYDGAREVYVMPIAGGRPEQVTFENGGATTRGWTPDGRVLYRSTRVPGPAKKCVLRTVEPESLNTETIAFLDATDAAYAPDGETLYVTRFGIELTGDNTRQYRGGLMAQLWRLRPDSGEEAERLAADFGAPIRHPMLYEGRLYFLSDKSGDDNFWSVDLDGGDAKQHTEFLGWRIRSPYLAGDSITYQRGADLFRYNLETEEETKLDITIASDRDRTRLRWLDEPLDYFASAHPGGDGTSVAVTARGRVAIAFPGPRRRIELDTPLTARARQAILGPEGEWVYLILDQDRFGEIWRYLANGLGEPEQLTEQSDAHIWGVYPSPDGTRVLYDDKQRRLWSLDLKTRIKGLLETGEAPDDSPFGGFTWSGGGRYVAYTVLDARSIRRVVVRDLETGRRVVASAGKYESFAPAFSADESWLYFVSNRHFSASPSSPWGDRNLGPAFKQRGKVYARRLTTEGRFPFSPATELIDQEEDEGDEGDDDDNDEGDSSSDSDDGDAEGDADEDDKEPEVEIDFDRITDRLWEAPVDPGDYRALAAGADFLYLRESDGDLKSVALDADDPNVETFAEDITDFSLSSDRKTLFFRKGAASTLALVKASERAPSDLDGRRVRIGDWRLAVVPLDEWHQMLLDAWRLHRAYAYDADLRGVDWDAVLDKHLPLVDRVGCRAELNDLLAEMTSNLGILHSQVRGGDQPEDDENATAAALGAEFEATEDGLQVVTIYRGEPHLPGRQGPLGRPDVDVREGDVITKINSLPVTTHADLHRRLQNRAGKQTRIDLTREGEELAVVVVPTRARSAAALPYHHWVQQNRERVEKASESQIGYLHLQAMGGADIESFARDYYEHFDKPGLIIDVRGNRGGNIDSWVLGTLLRRVWAFWENPAGGPPEVNMQQAFRGHLAVLIDEGTYSDGETFSAGVKALDLAPTFGQTTAGAGIWLTGRNRLVDRGVARIAEFPQFGLDGRWLIEGRGVSPDVPIVNPPVAAFHGADAQLDAGLEYLLEKIESEPLPKLRGKPLPPIGTNGRDVR